MGIGITAMTAYQRLREDGHLLNLKSVIELGSQGVPQSETEQRMARDIVRTFGVEVPEDEIIDAGSFHRALGCEIYKSIDADGQRGAMVFDLNKDLQAEYGFTEQFDLVTNHGTSEHVFDQCTCFRSIHNLCKNGGYMMHGLPFEGYLNHGFYNYQPSFYTDLAAANDYDVVGVYYTTSTKKVPGKYVGNNYSVIPYSEKIFEILAEKVAKGQFSVAPMRADSCLFVILRKTSDAEFKIPFDGLFTQSSTLSEYEGALRPDQFAFFDRDFDIEEEIERTMGQGRFAFRLRQAFQALMDKEKLKVKINNQIAKFK